MSIETFLCQGFSPCPAFAIFRSGTSPAEESIYSESLICYNIQKQKGGYEYGKDSSEYQWRNVMDNFLIHPFNAGFFFLLAVSAIPVAVGIIFFRHRDEGEKQKYVVTLYIALAIFFILYKSLLPLDKGYMIVCDQFYGGFTYLNELPLNPCNITLMIMPFALIRKNRKLIAMCFFESLLGAFLAFIMPISGFDGYPVFSIHIFGYYITHMTLFFAAFLLPVFGIYRPSCSDTKGVLSMMLLMACGVFVIDILLRMSGLCEAANYFFLFYHDGNALLKLVYDLIPIPFVYIVLIGCIVTVAVIPLITFLFGMRDVIKKRHQIGS